MNICSILLNFRFFTRWVSIQELSIPKKRSAARSAYKQKEETALRELRELAIDRDEWAGFTKKVCEVLEGLWLLLYFSAVDWNNLDAEGAFEQILRYAICTIL